MLSGWITFVLLLIGQLTTNPSVAGAQTWLATPDARSKATVVVGHATLTLPPGEWTAVSDAIDNPLQRGGQSLDIQTKWLAQTSGNQVVAIMSIRSNITHSSGKWGKDNQCRQRQALYISNPSESDGNFDCLLISKAIFSLGDNPTDFWVSTFDRLNALGKVPRTMICARFSMASRSRLDFIAVHVCVSPSYAGFPDDRARTVASGDWDKARITPDRQVFVDTLVAWAHSYHRTVADAF